MVFLLASCEIKGATMLPTPSDPAIVTAVTSPDHVGRQVDEVPGEHHDHNAEVVVEDQRIGAGGVVDGEVAGLKNSLSCVLDEEAGSRHLQAELVVGVPPRAIREGVRSTV